MKSIAFKLLMALGALMLVAGVTAQDPPADAPQVMLLDIDGGIGPATTDHLTRGLRQAEEAGAAALVLRIDTPGGLDAATRDINRAILASPVPVIAWVAPEGSRAASAGTYILYASHLAAMAPATSLGAASPVSIGGGEADGRPGAPGRPGGGERPSTGDDESEPAAAGDDDAEAGEESSGDPGSTAGRKAMNDAIAYLKGLADRHGRDVEFAEAAVRDAATLTAREALERGVVELIAGNLDDLLEQADGREVRMASGSATLAVAGAQVVAITPDWRNRILSVITNPSIAYLLILVGLYGLLLEGYSPGAIVPGVVGAISLLVALYAMQILPVNYAGLGLIILGIALIAAEAFVPSFGALGIGGVTALMFGSLMLFDRDVPGYAISNSVLWGVGFGSALLALAAAIAAGRSRRRRVTTGDDELLGETARVLADFHGSGRVHLRGEDWRARSDVPLQAGEHVRVTARDGLWLQVEPLSGTPPAHAATS